MAKKGKSARKRAERRERAKAREAGELIDVNEEASSDAAAAETPAQAAAEPAQTDRERREQKQASEEERENAWTRLTTFFKEVVIEARKINWPAREEATRSTMVVVVAIVFLAAFMGLWSFVFSRVAESAFKVNEPIVQPLTPGVTPGGVPGGGGSQVPGGGTGDETNGGTGGAEIPEE